LELMRDALAAVLETRVLGRAHEHYSSIDSTNDRALTWAKEGAPHGALVTADRQEAGRGRRGRSWASPATGDLYFSVVIRPAIVAATRRVDPTRWGAYGLAVGVALREGLLAAAPWLGELDLKWPNDLLWRGRKLAGILCEARWSGDGLEAIVVGVGINVGRRRFDEPDLAARATSLALIRDVDVERNVGREAELARGVLLGSILGALETVTEVFSRGGFPALRERYEPHCRLLGREVEIAATPGAPTSRAIAVGLDDDGALLVATAAGGRRRIEAADVWLATRDLGTTR
jgi:BirA family biotin operon repressor/biotin-[acetyl-CoA-carboxylase] ligase